MNFWKERGYRFYNPDIREYSVLDIIHIFFPTIEQIPKYADIGFSKHIDPKPIQENDK